MSNQNQSAQTPIDEIDNDKDKRVLRLLRIITIIQGDRTLNPARLASKLGVTERTLYRDLEALKRLDIPIDFDPVTQGYLIRKDFFLRSIEMTFEEAVSLTLLAQHVGSTGAIGQTESAGKALEKIRAVLPGKVLEEIEALMPRVAVSLARSENEGNKDVYRTVSEAITQKRSLLCRYESRRNEADPTADFRFDPYALYFGQRAWYAVGKRHDRDELRTLKLVRFTRCDPTDQPYAIPDDFSLDNYFGLAWRMMPGEKTYDVELRFDATAGETVVDTQWHSTQEFDIVGEETVVRFRVSGLDEITWWVLGYGRHCRVISPQELRDRVAKELREASKLYSD